MAKKILIALTSHSNFTIKIPEKEDITNITKALDNISSFINNNIFGVLTLIFFFLPSINIDGNYSLMIIIYATLLIALFVKLLRRVYFHTEHSPLLPYDLPSLFLTTAIAFSFFYNTVITLNNKNIWGGREFNEISGISLIAYFVLYYLYYTSGFSKLRSNKLILFFLLSPLISFLFALLFNAQILPSAYILLILLHPMYLFIFLKGDRYILISFVNILISSYLLLINAYFLTTLTLIITYLFLVIFIIINKRNDLYKMIRYLDRLDKPFDLKKYIKRNSELIFLILSIIFVLIGARWIYMNVSQDEINTIVKGYSSLASMNGLSLLLGQGYILTEAPKAIAIILSYGLIPLLISIVIIYKFLKDIKNTLLSLNDKRARSMMRSLLLGIIPMIIFIFLSKNHTDLIFLCLTILISLILLIRSQFNDNVNIITSEKTTQEVSIKANEQYFLNILKIIIIIIAFIILVYLLSFLNYINIFINT